MKKTIVSAALAASTLWVVTAPIVGCSPNALSGLPSLTAPTPTPTPGAGTASCPTNYVLVAANATYGTSAFCMAQYEMKVAQNDGTPVFDGYNGGVPLNVANYKAEARPSGVPWTSILYADALTECSSLGTGYHLATTKEWQVTAREVESVGSNWSGGSTGSGTLYKGNAIDTIAASAIADGDAVAGTNMLSARTGVDPYVGTGKTSSDTWGAGKEARRTFTLTSGEVIWDMSGNARELVDIDGLGGTLSYTGAGSSTYFEAGAAAFATAIGTTMTTNGVTLTTSLFFPSDPTWTRAVNYTGRVYVRSNGRTGKVVTRGGNTASGNSPGLYAGDWDQDAVTADGSGGFRCVAATL